MSDTHPTVLVLPGGYGDGPSFRDAAERQGLSVIGASSVRDDPARDGYRAWTWLPHVSDERFDAALAEAIGRFGVGEVHATHHTVGLHLGKVLPELAPGARLSLGRTHLDIEAEYKRLRRTVAEAPAIPELAAASGPRPPLTQVEAAAFIRAALSIPGESYEPKLLALIEVMRRAPQGDIVEIGSLFGRSAAFLALLARRYDLGRVLCVDPWSRDELDQGHEVLTEAGSAYDWASWREAFEINVLPLAHGRLNYIQAPSIAGERVYASGQPVETAAFGRTQYEGRIGVLHIDGNHEYAHVLEDSEAWRPKVKPGGWIIYDDYEWDWGDGPRRVADAFLKDHASEVRTHFVAGRAMFIQLRN